jgi:hypothetical protein
MQQDTEVERLDVRVAAQVTRWFELIRTPADEISFAELDALYHPDHLARWPREDEEARRQRFRRGEARGGLPEITGIESTSPFVVQATAVYANSRGFTITITFSEDAPHLIADERWDRIHDFELTLREATEGDAPTLADIERRSPVVTDDTSVAVDRGEDYFAAARLAGETTVMLAEIDGAPAGVAWGTPFRVYAAGAERSVWCFYHLRVLPEHQKKGMWGALAGKLWDVHADRCQYSVGYFSASNVAWRAIGMTSEDGNPNTWKHTLVRVYLDTPRTAGPDAGRPATPDDAARIVELLNACHGREEMYLPYTEVSLTQRMTRDPSEYSWSNVLVGEGAAVGVWSAGEHIRVITTRDGETNESRAGYVLDYGFEPGCEDELARLLCACCAKLASKGLHRLSIFTSEGSPSFPVLEPLASATERFLMTLGPGIREPEDVSERGLYVDHLYF